MIKIAVAGDYVSRYRVNELAEAGKFDVVMGEVKTTLADYDYRLVNLECPVFTSDASRIEKTGPCFKCEVSAVEMLKYAGFGGVTLANNHLCDFGPQGVEETLATLRRFGIDIVGGGSNLEEASKILYKKLKDKTVAIINCAEHEFSIATEQTPGANPLNPVRQYRDIQEARSKADYVLVVVHGGIEKHYYPSPRMQETYRFFIDAGADAVVNHHQHYASGYEFYQGKPIVYGVGNFCFDLTCFRNDPWNRGYVAGITFDDSGVGLQIMPFVQSDAEPSVSFLKGSDLDDFLGRIEKINTVISSPEALKENYNHFLEDTKGRFLSLLTPYSKRWARALYEKKLLPAYYPKKKWIELLNNIECESHRERLIYFIKSKLAE